MLRVTGPKQVCQFSRNDLMMPLTVIFYIKNWYPGFLFVKFQFLFSLLKGVGVNVSICSEQPSNVFIIMLILVLSDWIAIILGSIGGLIAFVIIICICCCIIVTLRGGV